MYNLKKKKDNQAEDFEDCCFCLFLNKS